MKKIFVALIMLFSIFPNISPASAAGCANTIWANLYPGECILEYSDEATAISGTNYRIQPELDSCSDYFSGIKLSTGYDRISYVRFQNVSLTGELKPNQTANVEVSITANCRAWSKSYSVTGEISFQDGTKVALSLEESNFRYREKFSGSLDSYCFTNICGTSTLTGSFKVPSSSIGSVALTLNVVYNQSSTQGVQLTPISAKYNYSGSLYAGTATPSATNSPSPIETSKSTRKDQTINAVNPENVSISARIYPFTASVTSNLPMTITLNSPDICNFKDGNFSLLSVGTCRSTLNQAGDSFWSPAPPVNIFFEILPTQFPSKVQKKSIKCAKGELIKKVTAKNPKCPVGYKKK